MKNINTINSESNNVVTCMACGCIIDPENAILIDGETYREDCAVECSFCGEYHLLSEMTDTEDGLVCERCLDYHYGYCECCETWQRTSYLNWSNAEDCYVCDDCLDNGDNYRRCDRCGEIHNTDDLNEVYTSNYDSELWCDHCREYHANYCSECEREFDDRYVTVEDECCEYCETPSQDCDDINAWEAPRGVRSYGYKPNPCFCPPEAKDDICFGFELEMEDHRNDGENVNKDADYMNDTLGFTYCKDYISVGKQKNYDIRLSEEELAAYRDELAESMGMYILPIGTEIHFSDGSYTFSDEACLLYIDQNDYIYRFCEDPLDFILYATDEEYTDIVFPEEDDDDV